MEIKPDKKLLTKHWYALLTISLVFAIIGGLLNLLLPLNPEVDLTILAIVIWGIYVGLNILMWGISVPLIKLWIKNLSYEIGDDRITVHKGIITKVTTNIPYRAVTDFMLHRSLYDRWLGIGTIMIQTAGQSHTATGYEGQLAGLIEWDGLLTQLRDRVKNLHVAGSATTVQEPTATGSDDEYLKLILDELKDIKKLLDK